MDRFRITYSTPDGIGREIIEQDSLESANEIAIERMLDAWSDKAWAFADKQ